MAISLVDAIAQEEGYGASSSNLPTRNNNPGNIVYGSFAASYGGVQDPNSQFAIFPNSAIGYQAETDLLSGPSYSGLTIAQAITKWNGNGSNSPSYISNVVNWTGLDSSTIVSDALASNNLGLDINNSNITDAGDSNTVFGDSSDNSNYDTDTSTNDSLIIGAVVMGLGALLLFNKL